jgi:hypothetical protein
MHKRPFRIDKEATGAAGFASRFSYVSRRTHPGSDPPHPCVYLAGLEDIGKRRHEVFVRDGFRCVVCNGLVDVNLPAWHPDAAHLAHLGGHTKVSRCWCLEALALKHSRCHGESDHHGRF